MPTSDQLQRFIFDDTDIRGEIIYLQHSFQQVLSNQQQPAAIQQLLGEFLAAVGLLSATMKFDGVFTLQAKGDGDVSLLMADCTRQHLLRAIATLLPGAVPTCTDLSQLITNGHLAITVDPAQGQRYQGIVPLEKGRLNECLEDYFKQSEQLPTKIWLFSDGQRAGGLLLQALPAQKQSKEQRKHYFEHLSALANTLNAKEFLATTSETILTRLFHEEKVRVFPATDMEFACSCSHARTAKMISLLGRKEAEKIIAESAVIEVQCEFCQQLYRFDGQAVDALFKKNDKTVH